MPFEDELGDALHRTGDTIHPADRPALVEGGLTRGRRRLARRRAAAVTGSVLALAVVGVGGAYGGGLLDGSGGSGTTGSVASPPKPTARGGATAEPVTKEQMISTLKSLLPEGETTQETGRGGEDDVPSMPYASVVFDDGKGAGAIGLSLNRVDPGGEGAAELTTCPSKSLVQYDACKAETLADGSRFMIFQGYVYPDRREETKEWRATLVTPKGIMVDASEFNAAAEKGAEVTRPAPPLTVAQMKDLVTAPEWQKFASAPRNADKGADKGAGKGTDKGAVPPAATGDSVQRALISLLPKDLKVADKGGGGEYAFVVVNDGKGKSMIGINVQPDMSDVKDDLIGAGGDVTTLPDGTTVIQRQEADPDQKGGEGAVAWTVDTIRKDGFRVVIMAFNSGAQGTDATRAEPALTMAQLKAIALDTKWRTLK
ncbi:hypothetical protein [Streptomyces sp. NPDC020681]|uniref:hypothetical protein n=1 Tax=Streptomyces sp. NPDC020681 TaxID=3365083 RepID=UPI0037A34287